MEAIFAHLSIARKFVSKGLTSLGVMPGGGSSPSEPRPPGPRPFEASTFARGEEDGGVTDTPFEVSTLALGEEDGGIIETPFEATTLAVGEEDGGIIDTPFEATTLALGEEDGNGMPQDQISDKLGEDGSNGTPTEYLTRTVGEDAIAPPIGETPYEATTLALGEEDGNAFDSPLEATTLAVGEEDSNTNRLR